MFTFISAFFASTFFDDYFKDAFLGLLLVIYFAVMLLTRPHVVKDASRVQR